MVLFILGLVLFVCLVVVHEFGHFIMAKRNGVEVEEFGLGFPPRLFKKKTKGGWLFTINLLPLGGFVKLKGEHDSDTEKGTFGAAPLGAKVKIALAGVTMNLITAFVLLTVLAAVGIPKLVDNQYTVARDTKVVKNEIIINFVEKDSPAAKAGIKQADHLLAITEGTQPCNYHNLKYAGEKPGTGELICAADLNYFPANTILAGGKDLTTFTSHHGGDTVILLVLRNGQEYVTQATLRTAREVTASQKTAEPKGYLGVAPTDFTVQRSTWSSPVVALGLIGQFTKLTFQGLGSAVAGVGKIIAGAVTGNSPAREHGQKQASEQVSGPVGIFVILRDGSSLGINFVLMIIAIISLTLAIMNVLPIPALDGGRLWLTLVTRALKRPLSPDREELINASGFVFLLLLILLITIVDVRRFF